jgi:hypothetical protein
MPELMGPADVSCAKPRLDIISVVWRNASHFRVALELGCCVPHEAYLMGQAVLVACRAESIDIGNSVLSHALRSRFACFLAGRRG